MLATMDRGHAHLPAGFQQTHSDLIARGVRLAPRYPTPFADPTPGYGPVEDFGEVLNVTAAASTFMHGLSGVDQDRNWLVSNILVATFFGLFAIVLVYRWIHQANSHMRHVVVMGRWEDQRYWMYNHTRIWPWIKKHLLYAPLGKNRHNREFKMPFTTEVGMGTLPSRFHTLLLVLYVLSNLAYCLALDYGHQDNTALLADLRGRSGQLAALNIIPTVLFALRNNPFIYITGVSYEAFNLIHRWAARVSVAEALIHTICWLVNTVRSGGAHQVAVSLATSQSFAWGMVSTAVFTFIIIVAASPIRHAFYETFLNGHRLLVAIALVGLYIHIDRANLPQLPYIQLVFAMWGFELFYRLARICYFNISRRKGLTKVTVEALPGEACRVTFDLRRPWVYTPGCHVHAYLPAMALWSSHPFSVAWAENKSKSPPLEVEGDKIPSNNPSEMFTGMEKRASLMPRTSSKGPSSTITAINETKTKLPNPSVPIESKVTSISLIMRARQGMTRKLYDKASKLPSGTLTTWGAIEGPYGGHETFASYGTVILFAGGVGITHCVGYVHHLLTQYTAGTCATRKILLVWSVPNTECLEWVRIWMDQILRMEHRREVLRIQLFVTKPRHRGEVVSNTGSVQMFPGRCNPATVLEKEMPERIGAVGVTVCGPGAFADSVRSAVREHVQDGCLDFVEEAFTY